mgnify:FL=1
MNRNIEAQYKTSKNLSTRISIHEKYSTNKQPFGDWIVEHYEIRPGFQILELGCGTGDMWKGKLNMLPTDAHLLLSDFSAGMLETAKKVLGNHQQVDYQSIDIQDIPFADASFDMVIANMMLYHVPDLHKGLSEVRRVLKPGRKFYCATYGEHGIMEFINDTLHDQGIHGEIGKTFTLQNGEGILQQHFDCVQMDIRDDGLEITDISDFVDYVMSLSSLTGTVESSCQDLYQAFREKSTNGILYVPKEYGMFICK